MRARRLLSIILSLACVIALALASRAHADGLHDKVFAEASEAYDKGDFEAAAKGFSDLAGSGVKSAALFYNLGNAEMRSGRLGHAILWYERARRLAPTDPDLLFNLQYARGLAKDESPTSDAEALLRVIFFPKWLLGPSAVQAATLMLNAVFWLAIGLNVFVRRRALRTFAAVVLFLLLVLAPTAVYELYEASAGSRAVVLGSTAEVRSGLSEDSTVLFTLHEGSVVRVNEARDGYMRIEFTRDKIGWIRKGSAGLI